MISITPVSNWDQFVECMTLRTQVYANLGFIDSRSSCDLDPFDWSSIHFAAVGEKKKVVGTIRLIIANVNPSVANLHLSLSRLFFDRMVDERRLTTSKATSLPIMETIRLNSDSVAAFDSRQPSELSRIIVAPDHRGRGISHMLSNAVVERACEVGCSDVYLQCLPNHVKLFGYFGFELMAESLVYHFLTVPDRVVAMRRNLYENVRSDQELFNSTGGDQSSFNRLPLRGK